MLDVLGILGVGALLGTFIGGLFIAGGWWPLERWKTILGLSISVLSVVILWLILG